MPVYVEQTGREREEGVESPALPKISATRAVE